jgi:phosphoglycolate phosphatase-like HAD superfamily hydrolase
MTGEGQAGRGCAVFDVDGTLLDTNYLHVAAWWEAFREHGMDVRSADIHRALGKDSKALVQAVIGRPHDGVIEAHSRFYGPYLGRLRPLPGAAGLLRATAALGAAVVLGTSAKPDELDLMLAALDAGDAISEVLSSGDVDAAKPAPDMIDAALEATSADRSRCVMVGDAVWDIQAAVKAGVPSIGLLSGGIGADELRSAGADAVYLDAAALLTDLASSPLHQCGGGGR